MKNVYILEIVSRFNLSGPEPLPHVEVQVVRTSQFFTVYRAEIPEQYLGTAIAKLEANCTDGSIITYFYEQKTT